MTTDFAALDELYPLPPAELSRQWVLTRKEDILPSSWPQLSLHGWHLALHPDANVCTLHCRNGEAIGWVVEPLAYLEGDVGFATQSKAITLPIEADFKPAELERALYGRDAHGLTNGNGLLGSWSAIVLSRTKSLQRVYMGVVHSLVYSPDAQIVATSHNLVPGLSRDEELSHAFDPLETTSYYTFGLTAFAGLKRLLPNHFLDLHTFENCRHWPSASLGEPVCGPEAAERIVEHAHKVIDVLAEHHSTIKVPLSAGRDSRAVLACLRPFADDPRVSLDTFTSLRPNSFDSEVDAQIAVKLAQVAGLPHTLKRVEPRTSQRADVQRAFVRLGESKFGSILGRPARELCPPPPDVLSLPGMAGETARGFYWGSAMPTADAVTPSALAKRTQSPVNDRVLEAANQWLENLPHFMRDSPCDILDLAYIEQRMGCWESSTRYLFPGAGRANLSLMATAISLEMILRLPREYRAAGHLQRDMVAYGWPELLRFPFNSPVGPLKVRNMYLRLRRFPRRVFLAVHRRLALLK